MKGKVYLVGAGPGDPELLTLKAFRVLQTADVVLHDELVAPEVLKLISQTACVHNVGKRCGRKRVAQEEINWLMVAFANSGFNVVRLKGGDPLVFGRVGEEMQVLRDAGIDFEVIPGITAALGAAAVAQVPLTRRGISSALVFVTGHGADGAPHNWAGLVSVGGTLALYMPGDDYETVARRLRSAGLGGTTPCALLSRATTREQEIYLTTVDELPNAPRLAPPALLLAGKVVAFARDASGKNQCACPFQPSKTVDGALEYCARIHVATEVQAPNA